MKALVLSKVKQPLRLEDRPAPLPAPGQALVALKAAALNRRDFWITRGMYPGVRTPVILGSDGAGVVAEVGNDVSGDLVGQEVVINPGWDWGESEAAQSSAFRILGMPDDGTFAESVAVPAEYLHPKPTHLDWHEAAALPLAGVTAYRAVFSRGELQPGETMLVSGIGGGVAMFALQFAVAAGATVLVTSSSDEKITNAVELGATAGFNYRAEDWHKRLRAKHEPVDLIIDSAGGEGYGRLIGLAAAGGRIVN